MGLIQNKVTVSQPNSHIIVKNAGGLRGLTGEEGPQGDKGDQGDPGQAATVAVGTTTTLPAGSSATVTNTGTSSDAVFNFGIPQGATGATGPAGPANTLSIGTVQGGDTAAATITGTAPNQTLNLTLPKGDQGDPGPEPEMVRNVKGTTIELTDAGSNIVSLNDIYGDTEQTTYSGINTAFLNQSLNTNVGSYTFTSQTDANITATKAATGGKFFAAFEAQVVSGHTYRLKGYAEASSGTVAIYSYKDQTWGTSVDPVMPYRGTGDIDTTFTANYTGKYVFAAYSDDTVGATVSVKNIMFGENVQSSSSYEPYVGGVPSPNPDFPQTVQTVTGEQTITITDGENQTSSYAVNLARNLLDPFANFNAGQSYTHNGITYTFNADGSIKVKGTASALSYVDIVGNISYDYTTARLTIPSTYSVGSWTDSNIKLSARQTNGGYIDLYSGGGATTGSHAGKICGAFYIQVASGAVVDETIYPQIVSGSTLPTYMLPISLCKIGDYQDYIYKSGNNWYVRKNTWRVTFNGSESWFYNTYNKNLIFTNDGSSYLPSGTTYIGYSNGGTIACNYFTPRQQGEQDGSGLCFASSPNFMVCNYGGKTNFDTGDNFKNWLRLHAMHVYYQLDTPYDTQITDATLISQLNAVSSAALYEGNTDITVTSSNLAGELDLDYWTYFHRFIDTGDIVDAAVTPAKASFTTYSTTEQVVGTWTDGKPLYRKVVPFTTPTSGNTTTVLVDANLKMCVMTTGCIQYGNTSVPLPFFATAGGDQTKTWVENGYLYIRNNSSTYNGASGYAIVEYTKNTD